MSKFEIQFDDLDTPLRADKPVERMTTAQITTAAHIANGGTEMFDCPKCRGTGQTRWGACFSCQGKGKRSKRSLAATQAGQTRRENEADRRADFHREHADVVAFLAANSDWSDFYRSLNDKLAEYGTLTENQLAAVVRGMVKQAERRAEKAAARVAAAPVIDNISAVQALFDRAPVKLVKSPVFRTTEITINRAKETSRNPGALYVKTTRDQTYCGKIVDGRFHKAYGAPDVTEALRAVAVDPTGEAIKYATEFKACCCCGKSLHNPVSVLAVVGPVCGPRWGLDHLRMEAAALLAAEKAAEDAA